MTIRVAETCSRHTISIEHSYRFVCIFYSFAKPNQEIPYLSLYGTPFRIDLGDAENISYGWPSALCAVRLMYGHLRPTSISVLEKLNVAW